MMANSHNNSNLEQHATCSLLILWPQVQLQNQKSGQNPITSGWSCLVLALGASPNSFCEQHWTIPTPNPSTNTSATPQPTSTWLSPCPQRRSRWQWRRRPRFPAWRVLSAPPGTTTCRWPHGCSQPSRHSLLCRSLVWGNHCKKWCMICVIICFRFVCFCFFDLSNYLRQYRIFSVYPPCLSSHYISLSIYKFKSYILHQIFLLYLSTHLCSLLV